MTTITFHPGSNEPDVIAQVISVTETHVVAETEAADYEFTKEGLSDLVMHGDASIDGVVQ